MFMRYYGHAAETLLELYGNQVFA